jgi:hypothetical protein
MAILASLKNFFGMSTTDEEFDGDIEASLNESVQALPGVPVLQPATDVKSVANTEMPLGAPGDMPVEVADAVIDIVDEALPPFVRDCIDRDAQRRKLLEVMTPAMSGYVARIAAETRSAALSSTAGDRDKLQQEVEALRQERQRLDSKREEQSGQLLAEQRQRRALTERVRALEAKEATYEAEREQYELELKSLMNKLRVAEAGGEVAATAPSPAAVVDTETAEKLQASEQKVTELTARIEELTARLAQVEPMANELQTSRIHEAEFKAQVDAELLKSRQLRATVSELEQKLAKSDRAAEIESLNNTIATLQARLADTSAIDAMQATISAKDAEIADLQNRLSEATAPAALDALLAERQRMLNPEGEAETQQRAPKRRRGRPRKNPVAEEVSGAFNDVDDSASELANSVDWLLPGLDTASAHPQQVSDPEFGYQPAKKSAYAAADDNQPLLF